MDPDKLDRLAAAGFVVGSVKELLGLDEEDMEHINAALVGDNAEMELTLIKDLYGPSGAPEGTEVDVRVRQKASWADRNDPEFEEEYRGTITRETSTESRITDEGPIVLGEDARERFPIEDVKEGDLE